MPPSARPPHARWIFEELQRLAPGRLAIEDWIAIEGELDADGTRREREVAPLRRSLRERYPDQFWLNWPSLKPDDARRRVWAIRDLELDLDRRFFAATASALGSDWSDPLRRVALRRVRALLRPWPLLDGMPVDLETMLPEGAVDPEMQRTLDEWSGAYADATAAIERERRVAFDRLAAWLGQEGLREESSTNPDDAWMTPAFEQWESASHALTARIRSLLALQDRAMLRLAERLGPEDGTRFVDAVLCRAYRISNVENRAFAAHDLDRAAKRHRRDPERLPAIEELRRTYRADDAAILLRWCRETRELAPAWCPLTMEHWGPERRYASIESRRPALDQDRRALAARALASLSRIEGGKVPDAGLGEEEDEAEQGVVRV